MAQEKLKTSWCAHYDCDALWIQNFQDGDEGRENERLNAGMAPTCNWRIKIVSN